MKMMALRGVIARRSISYVSSTDLGLQLATTMTPGVTTTVSFGAGAPLTEQSSTAFIIPVVRSALRGPASNMFDHLSMPRMESLVGRSTMAAMMSCGSNAAKRPVVFWTEKAVPVILQAIDDSDNSDRVVKLRTSASRAMECAAAAGAKAASFVLHADATSSEIDALVRISVTASHTFDRHLTKKPDRIAAMHFIDMTGDDVDASAARADIHQKRAPLQQTIAEGTVLARELANERADCVTPEYMEQFVRSMSDTFSDGRLRTRTIKGVDALRQSGLSMLAAVGQAAVVPPRLVVIEYCPPGIDCQEVRPIGLVGKGITFDTGGLNLKPTGSIESMHMDMAGAAAVIGALRTIAISGYNRPVIAVLALAENAIGARSYKPHAVLPSAKGSVLVSNTDAEGRLCLADALSYIQAQHQPAIVLDIATLTGACVVALGEYAAGLFSNDDQLANDIVSCGNQSFERCWRLPIFQEHLDELKGKQTDLNSCGKNRQGGASTAAAFLSKYIETGTRWAHLDIAGPGMYSRKINHMPEGGTGFGAQLLADYILRHSWS